VFQARLMAGGFEASNAGLNASFSRRGAMVSGGGVSWHVGLSAYGYGTSLTSAAKVVPDAHANDVQYARAGIDEWYANGPLGLEQGFTLRRRLPRSGPGSLTLELGDLPSSVHGDVTDAGRGLLLTRRGSVLLRYSGLVAVDRDGRSLPARIALWGRRVLVRVDDRGAVYPLRIDPFVQLAELTASDADNSNAFGDAAVAISGNTIAVGSGSQNAVYVFTEPAGGWASGQETAKLTAASGAAGLGSSVAISGNTIVAGAVATTIGGNAYQGAVYVFTEPPGGWASETQTAELTASDGATADYLGVSVAMSGNTIAAGALGVGNTGPLTNGYGAVYVFTEPTGGWANGHQTAELTASTGAGGETLGDSVAISGTTIVAGAAEATVNGLADEGAVYVFTAPAGGWVDETQTAELTASDGTADDYLGGSVAMSGNTIAVGDASLVVGGNVGQGGVLVFTEPAGGWVNGHETAILTASGGTAGDRLGTSVATTGNTIVAAAQGAGGTSDMAGPGAMYVFTSGPGGWASGYTSNMFAATVSADVIGLGTSTAVSGDTIVVGAHGPGSADAVYVFGATGLGPSITSVSPASGSTAGGVMVTVSGSNLGGAISVDFGSSAATLVSVAASGDSLTALAPPHAAGVVDVTVTTPEGTSTTSDADEYTYLLSVSAVPDVSNPTIVIDGSGFGTAASSSTAVHADGYSPYLRVVDESASPVWDAGGYDSQGNQDPCTVIIGSWTPTQIIVSPQVDHGWPQPCNFQVGDTLSVYVWPTGDTSATPLVGTTTVVAPQGAAPDVSAVSPDFGPVSGGTTASTSGTVTVTGSNFSGAEAVWFGQDYAVAPTSSTSGSVTVDPPPIGDAEGVQVQVATPAGTWQPSGVCVLQKGCTGAYFFMSGVFGNQTLTEPINVSCSHGASGMSCTVDGVQVGVPIPGAQNPLACLGYPSPGTGTPTAQNDDNASVSISGSGTLAIDGDFGLATNAGVPSAFVADGTITLEYLTLSATVQGTLSYQWQLPLAAPPVLNPCIDDLYVLLTPSVSVSGTVTVNAGDLAANMAASWVNGQGNPVAVPSLTCVGTPVSFDDFGNCVGISLSGSASLGFTGGLLFQVGPDDYNAGVSALFAASAGIDTSLSPSETYVNACGEIAWGAAGFGVTVGGPLLGPVNLYASEPEASTDCPLGSVTPTSESSGATSASQGDYSITGVGSGTVSIGPYSLDPVAPPTFLSNGQLFDASIAPGSTYSSVSIKVCDVGDSDAGIEWWNPTANPAGGAWKAVTPAATYSSSSGCVTFTVTGSSSPDLAQLTGTVFAVRIIARHRQPVVQLLSVVTGPTVGGTRVVITGVNFTRVTSVRFGSNTARFRVASASKIVATTPAGRGTTNVVVTTSHGTSPRIKPDHFVYDTLGVSRVSPFAGPTRGGTAVTISGWGLQHASKVMFGSARAHFKIITATEIIATTPANTGIVAVTIQSHGRSSASSLQAQFAYDTGT
jgi:hypothetical protein